ncbi:hypothetical protein AAMO2058_000680100 [Amorphochlora amoebiformis]
MYITIMVYWVPMKACEDVHGVTVWNLNVTIYTHMLRLHREKRVTHLCTRIYLSRLLCIHFGCTNPINIEIIIKSLHWSILPCNYHSFGSGRLIVKSYQCDDLLISFFLILVSEVNSRFICLTQLFPTSRSNVPPHPEVIPIVSSLFPPPPTLILSSINNPFSFRQPPEIPKSSIQERYICPLPYTCMSPFPPIRSSSPGDRRRRESSNTNPKRTNKGTNKKMNKGTNKKMNKGTNKKMNKRMNKRMNKTINKKESPSNDNMNKSSKSKMRNKSKMMNKRTNKRKSQSNTKCGNNTNNIIVVGTKATELGLPQMVWDPLRLLDWIGY